MALQLSRLRRALPARGAVYAVVVSLCVSAMSSLAQVAPQAEPYRIDGPAGGTSRTLPSGEKVIEVLGGVRIWGNGIDARGQRARRYTSDLSMDLVENVEVVSDSLTLWCDSLRVYQDPELGHAFGSVRILTLEGTKGYGDRAHYRRSDDWLSLAGDARIIDGEYVIEGDSISFDRAAGFMEAFGAVKVVDERNRSVVEGRHGIFNRDTGIAIVDSLPVFNSRRGTGPGIAVTSEWMSFDRESESSTSIGDVNFRQGTTLAHADTARYVGENLLVMSGAPSVEQEGRVMSGRIIRFHYIDNALHKIDVFGEASLVDSTPDTLDQDFSSIPLANVLTGDTLIIEIEDDEIQRTKVVGGARSVYLPEDQKSAISVNNVSGDMIDIHFNDGVVDEVLVLGSVSGKYYFLERKEIRAEADSIIAANDSLLTAALDSVVVTVLDSLQADLSIAESDSSESGSRIDFESSAQLVEYQGETTFFEVARGRIRISESAVVKNGTLELHADKINFDTDERELLAEGDPKLIDRETEIVGERMGYLFEHQTGAVGDGATRFDDGFYYGKHIRRIDKKTLLVGNGTFTTCDLANPHYHFRAHKMKLKVGESVVARRVTLHLSDIPLITLPFYYKDLVKGRRSGILFPNMNIGVSSREGRYVRDLGYYWATNEYTDFKFEMDYNERREATFQLENVYNKRYSFDGNARFEYLRRFSETSKGDEWKLTARHNQPALLDDWRFNTRVEVSSKDITRTNLSGNSNVELLDSRLYSTASLSRSFSNGVSMNVSGTRSQFPNADDGDPSDDGRLSELSVPVSLSFKSRPLWPGRQKSGDNFLVGALRDMTFSQRYSGKYDRKRGEASEDDIVSGNGSFGLTYAPSSVGPFKITSSASFAERWQYRNFEKRAYGSQAIILPDGTQEDVLYHDEANDQLVDESDTTPSLSFSNSLGTDVYGIFSTRLGRVRGMKHKISMSATHNYRPQLGDKQVSSQDVGLSLGNEFSLKVADVDENGEVQVDDEGVEKTKKLDQLIVWRLNTSFDPDAPAKSQWRDVSSSLTLRPGVTNAISFSMSQTIDPYLFEVKSTRFNSDLRLRGGLDLGGVLRNRTEPKNPILERLPEAAADSTDEDRNPNPDDPNYERRQRENDLENWLETGDENRVPWDFYLRGSVTQTRLAGGDFRTSANLSTSASVSLPGTWKFSYSANFDVERGEFTNQFWSLNRPIHCWKLEFSRGLADGQDFGISLYLDAIPDLRIDRGDRARRNFRSSVGAF